MGSGGCSPATSCRRRTCAGGAARDRAPYDLWAAQGFIEATPGNVVDYGAIEQRILADAALFQVREIAYDPWNATHIALRLQDEGATMVEFRQGFRSMSAPTRELEKLIVSRKLAHGANPVTRWMAANVAVAQDPAGNLKPAKDKSTERIDGIVALIMAIGRAMVVQEEPQPSYQMVIL
jgi:phage terminase large subunit-like protein